MKSSNARPTVKDGRKALDIARKTINLWVTKKEKFVPIKYPKSFDQNAGIFTTIYTHPERNLRGCIGYPEPFMPLIRSLINSAIHATEDPRFPNLTQDELGRVLVEVSILTRPVEIKAEPEEIIRKIMIGRHGLIIRKYGLSGLLLPQIAVEHNMNATEFLDQTCMKAYLPTDAWKDPATSVYTFESCIFHEEKPPRRIE